jgi:hypothetical protein
MLQKNIKFPNSFVKKMTKFVREIFLKKTNDGKIYESQLEITLYSLGFTMLHIISDNQLIEKGESVLRKLSFQLNKYIYRLMLNASFIELDLA